MSSIYKVMLAGSPEAAYRPRPRTQSPRIVSLYRPQGQFAQNALPMFPIGLISINPLHRSHLTVTTWPSCEYSSRAFNQQVDVRLVIIVCHGYFFTGEKERERGRGRYPTDPGHALKRI
jgi:hypothetical protein